MLTLTRRNGESMQIITEDSKVIEIKIIDIKGNSVKIAFDAPEDCLILREELLEEPHH